MANGPVDYRDPEGQLWALQEGDVPQVPQAPPVPQPPQGPMIPEDMPQQPPSAPVDIMDLDPMTLNRMGLKRDPGQAASPEHWAKKGRSGAVQEREGAPERRAEMAERERGLAVYEGEIAADDARLQQQFISNQLDEQQLRMQEKQKEVAQLETRYREERDGLDQQMAQQRALADKGFGMDRIMGTTEGQMGMMMSALGMTIAAFGGTDTARNAQTVHQRYVDQLVKGQEAEWEAQQGQIDSAYSRMMQTYGDRDQARSAVELMLNDNSKMQLEKLMLQNADPRVKAQVERQILEIDQRSEALEEAFHERSTGKVSEQFHEAKAYIAPSVRQMSQDEQVHFMEGQAKMAEAAKRIVDATVQESQGAGQPAGLSGRTKLVNDYAGANQTLDFLNKMSLMRGEEGLDFETGQYIGRKEGFWDDKVPGRGVFGAAGKAVPSLNPEGVDYDRMMQLAINSYRQQITGQAAAEAELKRIVSQVDSVFEHEHLAGVQALTEAIRSQQAGIESTLDQESAEWLRMRRGQTLSGATTPGSFGDTVRGG